MAEPQFHLGTPEHCNAPMKWRGTNCRWEDRPGDGAEIRSIRYSCISCDATLVCELREPDGRSGAA